MADCELSVIIPCHNAGRYLSQAIDSVLRQESSVRSSEVIVVNDHSTDRDTLDALSRWERTPGVRVFHNAGRPGPGAARNLGIDAAEGRWVAFLDADDVWLPGGLEARWQVVQSEPDAEWIGADLRLWHEDGTLAGDGYFQAGDLSGQLLSEAYRTGGVFRMRRPVKEFLRSALAWTGTVMVKRDLIRHLGGFDPNLQQAQDLHMWIRLSLVSDFFFVPRIVALYRQHAASLTHRGESPERWSIAAYRRLLRDPNFRPYRALQRVKLALCYQADAYYHRERGEMWHAARAAALALNYTPLSLANWKNLVASLVRKR